MPLDIRTFTNADHRTGWRPGNNPGGHTLFKALGHPLTAPKAAALIDRLADAGPIAVYDPLRQADDFAAFYGLERCEIAGVYVQQVEHLADTILGRQPEPVTAIAASRAATVLVVAFDAEGLIDQIRPVLAAGAAVVSLDEIRIPDAMLSNPRTYVEPINFATNLALFRDGPDGHTRLTGANYWSAYGAEDPAIWLCLFDGEGTRLAEWEQPLAGANASFAIDSRAVRDRFELDDFAGTLYMHAIRIRGHDVVKYALDTFSGDLRELSCSHDANAWPAELYAGMPAPEPGESLLLWIQNSHPLVIPRGAIGFNRMGSEDVVPLDREIPPYATYPVDVGELLPDARWPDQIEIQAGRYFVRPRYEVVRDRAGPGGRRRIAHANVERVDLEPDPAIPELGELIGKGYIMPLPVLPLDTFHSVSLPTPMATGQRELPLRVELIDATGRVAATKYLGRVARHVSVVVDVDDWLAEAAAELASGYGHVEYMYDFRDGGEADGWLHALGRYELRASGHRAETIFGAHIYNTPLVFRDEPQSYAARPPGLTTRLFLRLGEAGLDTLCHLIYPASLPWHKTSTTELTLFDASAGEVARRVMHIPCGGSLHWRYHDMFEPPLRAEAGPGAYVQVRDTTCRLFGFHGLINGRTSFCLDHMFGF